MKRSSLVLVGAFAVLASGAATAAPIYMKFEGVDGESAAADHRAWIEIESYSLGSNSLPASPAAPSPAGIAKIGPGTLSFSKKIDKSSPVLQKSAAAGKVFQNVSLDILKPGGGNTYLKYELKNVMISSYSLGGGGAVPSDHATINFGSAELKYAAQKSSSRPGPGVASPNRFSPGVVKSK